MSIIGITYFVHGTTTDSEKDLATGWAAGELSELGIKQVKDLGALVSHEYFDVVFSSDLKRAVDSALIAFGDRYGIIPDSRLRECNYGSLTLKPAQEFQNNMSDYIEIPYSGGESYRQVEERIADFLDMLKKEYCGKTVAVVAHQAPQLALDVLIGDKSWPQAIDEDWRKSGAWQPGWEYEIEC